MSSGVCGGGDRRVLVKLTSVMNNPHHPLHESVLSSSFRLKLTDQSTAVSLLHHDVMSHVDIVDHHSHATWMMHLICMDVYVCLHVHIYTFLDSDSRRIAEMYFSVTHAVCACT